MGPALADSEPVHRKTASKIRDRLLSHGALPANREVRSNLSTSTSAVSTRVSYSPHGTPSPQEQTATRHKIKHRRCVATTATTTYLSYAVRAVVLGEWNLMAEADHRNSRL